jgi:LysR family transcriptional regulator, transcriptional activator of the cysJI operon
VAQLENARLRVFRVVAEQLSFHKAAEKLFLTQPAVTLQIKALEEDVGVRLFDRAAGRVSLTSQAEILLRYAQELAIAAKAEQDLASAYGRASGTLELGVSTTIAQYILPRLIAAFLAENSVYFSLAS